jgi:hypothetical protein
MSLRVHNAAIAAATYRTLKGLANVLDTSSKLTRAVNRVTIGSDCNHMRSMEASSNPGRLHISGQLDCSAILRPPCTNPHRIRKIPAMNAP